MVSDASSMYGQMLAGHGTAPAPGNDRLSVLPGRKLLSIVCDGAD